MLKPNDALHDWVFKLIKSLKNERFIYIRTNHFGVLRNLEILHPLLKHNVYP